MEPVHRSGPPPLPVVMMIGGQFNTPVDLLRAGDAITTLDAFAAAHGGNAPVAVFVDPNGTFGNDTECVVDDREPDPKAAANVCRLTRPGLEHGRRHDP